MEERRKHARFRSATIIQFKDGIFSAQVDAVTKDVGLGGVCFFTEKKMKIGTVVKVRLFYDVKGPGKLLKGKIAWACKTTSGPQGYLNGLSFLR